MGGIRRRRMCDTCQARFTTYERILDDDHALTDAVNALESVKDGARELHALVFRAIKDFKGEDGADTAEKGE